MANIFIIFVCVYKECAIMREKIGKSVRLVFFWFFFFCEIDEISFLQLIKNLIMWQSEGAQILRFAVRGGSARRAVRRYKFNDIFFAFDTSRYTYTTLLFILQRRSLLPLLLFYLEFLYFFSVVVVAVCATNSRRRLDRKRYLFQTWTRRMKRTFSGW
jgi:hypothetical protein